MKPIKSKLKRLRRRSSRSKLRLKNYKKTMLSNKPNQVNSRKQRNKLNNSLPQLKLT